MLLIVDKIVLILDKKMYNLNKNVALCRLIIFSKYVEKLYISDNKNGDSSEFKVLI